MIAFGLPTPEDNFHRTKINIYLVLVLNTKVVRIVGSRSNMWSSGKIGIIQS
jgi:hypothetical protein